MKAELIIIGNELLNGKINDKNTLQFAKICQDQGIDLSHVSFIQDNKESFNKQIELATMRSDLIVTSGGLGPTKDDLTKSFLSDFFKKDIFFSQEALKLVSKQYEAFGKKFEKDKSDYQNIPKDFEVVFNPTGYAPGLSYEFSQDKFILATPGVPSEFKSMTHHFLEQRIPKRNNSFNQVIVKTRFIPESKIFNELCPGLWERLERFGEVSSLPNPLGVDIGVSLNNEADKEEVIKIISDSNIKDNIWQIGSKSLEELIVSEAKAKNLTFGFAESCTGGLCASRITDISGCSQVFWGSVVSYSNEVKERVINVSQSTLSDHGAVSLQTAKEMAHGAKLSMNVDIAVSTTGIAGPSGGSEQKPVGTVGIGFSYKDQNSSVIHHFRGNREDLKYRFSQSALFQLLDLIRKF